jgi:ABC-type ATPase involved in cell division/ABC-type molybdate transport system permease subunit
LPIGTWLALSLFRSRSLVLSVVNTGMALPPVVVGLFVALLLWRNGFLGGLGLMYTPTAMVIAEVIIATPVVIGLTAAGLGQLDPRLESQLLGLGASRWQSVWWMWKEARLPLLAAVMAAFGSVISEVGAAMMVGGNIAGQTRVLTTSIVLQDESRRVRGRRRTGARPARAGLHGERRPHVGAAAGPEALMADRSALPAPVLLEVRDLLVSRGGRRILEVDDLAIHEGEVLTVVGPNGAGKSTLLLALARLLQPDRGTMSFEERPLSKADDLTYWRRIGLVLPAPLLLTASVFDNVAAGLRFRGMPVSEIRGRVDDWLARLSIAHLRDRPARQLSSGEAQRASLARAFVLEPRLLLPTKWLACEISWTPSGRNRRTTYRGNGRWSGSMRWPKPGTRPT